MQARQETLQEGIARLGPDPHTPIARFLEHYLTKDVEHRIESVKWKCRDVIAQGDVLSYDGPTLQLLPHYALRKGESVLLLDFNAPVIAHPENYSEPLKQVLQKAAWYTTGTNTNFIVSSSWEGLMQALVTLAPRFSVVGVLKNLNVKYSSMVKAQEFNPDIWEKVRSKPFPVIAIDPFDLFESVTGRQFPDMSD